jgi:hypothetical protein
MFSPAPLGHATQFAMVQFWKMGSFWRLLSWRNSSAAMLTGIHVENDRRRHEFRHRDARPVRKRRHLQDTWTDGVHSVCHGQTRLKNNFLGSLWHRLKSATAQFVAAIARQLFFSTLEFASGPHKLILTMTEATTLHTFHTVEWRKIWIWNKWSADLQARHWWLSGIVHCRLDQGLQFKTLFLQLFLNVFAIQHAIVDIIWTVVGKLNGQKVLLLTIWGSSVARLPQRSLRLTVRDLDFRICFPNFWQSGSMPLLMSAIWIVVGLLHGQKILLPVDNPGCIVVLWPVQCICSSLPGGDVNIGGITAIMPVSWEKNQMTLENQQDLEFHDQGGNNAPPGSCG